MVIDMVKRESEAVKKVKATIARLDELERRTEVEKEAEKLICEGKYSEAIELLNTLD